MSDQSDNNIKLLTPFGLSEQEAKIYLLLVRKGVLSALTISREIHMARTKVYRILDKLLAKNLVTVRLDDMGKKFEVGSYKELEFLVAEKETEAAKLKNDLPMVFNQLAVLAGHGSGESKVLYYTGIEGLKQITWNSLRTKEVLRIFERSSMNEFMDKNYAEKMRERFVENDVHTHQLTNLKHMEAYTKNAEHVKRTEVRHLDPAEMEVVFEMLVYNDVVAIYNFTDEDKFGVEIYNDKLAKMQKQLFDYIWKKAKKMRIVNDRGEAVLAS